MFIPLFRKLLGGGGLNDLDTQDDPAININTTWDINTSSLKTNFKML